MNQQQYRSYLSADYVKAINEFPIQLALVKTLSTSNLTKNLEDRLSLTLEAFVLLLLVSFFYYFEKSKIESRLSDLSLSSRRIPKVIDISH